MRVLALDWGAVRIGAAVSDPDGKIAFPLDHFIENKNAIAEIKKIIGDLKAEKIIIGMPINLAGEEGFTASKVKKFVEDLQKQVSCSLELLDERFSSVEAGKRLSEQGMNEKDQRGIKDNLAAQILLQRYLNISNQGDGRNKN